MVSLDELTSQVAKVIRKSKNTVLFSGAGISTPSGVPDFRSATNGLWKKFNPMQVASLSVFKNNPKKFFDWLHPLVVNCLNALPNPAHRIIAEMQEKGLIQTILTQNIDGLHQKAGSRNVLELHGNPRIMTCLSCRIEFTEPDYFNRFVNYGQIPVCPDCGDILKPNIILYGEELPQGVWRQAEKACMETNTLIIAGTSLEVFPAASLPIIAYNHDAFLCINNLTPTPCDSLTDCVFHMDVVDFFQRLEEVL